MAKAVRTGLFRLWGNRMYNILESKFAETLAREGREVKLGDKTIIGFFRRVADGKNEDGYTLFYTAQTNNVPQGAILSFGAEHYMCVNKEHNPVETTVYNKYMLERCNYIVKWNLSCDILETPAIVDTGAQAFKGSGVLVVDGPIMVTIEDTPEARKIAPNQRFLVGGGNPFKVVARIFMNGKCYITGNADALDPLDDLENEIANGLDCNPPTPPEPSEITYTISPPDITEIGIGEEQIYTFKKWGDSVEIPSVWTFSASGAASNCYTLTKINDNQVKIACKNSHKTALTLKGVCDDGHIETKAIWLTSGW